MASEVDTLSFGGGARVDTAGLATAGGLLNPAHPRLHHLFEATVDAMPEALALVCGEAQLTYRELEQRANRLALHLISTGTRPGDRVGLLVDRSVETYVAILGILKAGAAYVPIDRSFPAERVAFISDDLALASLLTTSDFETVTACLACPVINLDLCDAALEVPSPPASRPVVAGTGDALCYVIYTSGSSGQPKGVAVSHANVCAYLAAVEPIYGVTAWDRVHQGMTIAFDFSVEEIWVTWMSGAALIAGATDGRGIGSGLAEFLTEHLVTVFCCVPTVLATIDRDVPSVRTIIAGGETLPRDLAVRWHRPGRRILNTYGPTETTVTATWVEVAPDRPVTIGKPLPTYRVHVLDEELRPVPRGKPGEICIGGPGVAQGYVNRPELTSERFVPDHVGGTAGRLYRSGDLGRLLPSGEIEFLGRIDSQVKLRGYRIELGEIEALVAEDEAVQDVVVSTVAPAGVVEELAAYITLTDGADRVASGNIDITHRLHGVLRRRLPAYMVPAFIEVVAEIPRRASGKADRSRLPAPASARLGAQSTHHVDPATPLEYELAIDWCALFGRDEVSVEADFFLDLGGHSLFAATLVSALRSRPEWAGLAIADLYANPTVRSLARHMARMDPRATEQDGDAGTHVSKARRASTGRVIACGLSQAIALYAVFVMMAAPVGWLLSGLGGRPTVSLLVASAGVVASSFMVGSFLLPVAACRLLTRGIRPGRYPIWGAVYFRCWFVRKLLALGSLHLLAGSPLMAPYLRLLGARIGRGCQIATPKTPLPYLLDIGDGASIGYGADLHPYAVENGELSLAAIHIGPGAFVGANALVLGGADIGESSRLGEQSLAAADQRIPAGEHWSGSPSRPRPEGDPVLDAMQSNGDVPVRWSAAVTGGFAATLLVLAALPFAMALPGLVIIGLADRSGGPGWAFASTFAAAPTFVLTACLLVWLGKRVFRTTREAGVYPLRSTFGLRKWVSDKLMAISLMVSNSLYATLYTLPWLRLLGAKVGRRAEVSTVAHVDPDLLVLGPESFVADFAAVGPATYHNGLVALGPTELGRRCFVGNASLVGIHRHLGDNSLLGVHSVPPARPVDAGTSWLGSPAIYLPRRQVCDTFAEDVTYRPARRLVAWRLAIEYFRVTLPATLLYAVSVLGVLLEAKLTSGLPLAAVIALTPAVAMGAVLAATLIVAGLKWLIVGRYRPRTAPLWSRFVWRSELVTGLYESVVVPLLLNWLTGTPWICPVLRLLGARIGKRVLLDSTFVTEFDLVTIGDDAAIDNWTSLQTHLFEDRVMKMSTLTIGAGCSIGPRSVVLYDAELAEGARLDGLSLVMKGEALPAGALWRGIPAQAVD